MKEWAVVELAGFESAPRLYSRRAWRLPSQLRLLWRRAAANPGLTLVSLLTLAVAIGANVAIFAVVNAVLRRPLPFPDSERLVLLRHVAPQLGPLNDLPMSDGLHFLYAEQSRTLDGVVGFNDVAVSFTDPDNPQRVPAASITASFFDVLRTPPRLGRPFTSEEDRPGAAPVVVLGDGLWRSRFGADPGVVGRVVEIDRESGRGGGRDAPGLRVPAARRPSSGGRWPRPGERPAGLLRVERRGAPGRRRVAGAGAGRTRRHVVESGGAPSRSARRAGPGEGVPAADRACPGVVGRRHRGDVVDPVGRRRVSCC